MALLCAIPYLTHNLGQAFAQYDEILLKPGVLVRTAAVEAALDPSRYRLFFVGRRGTGKTAISRHVAFKERDVRHRRCNPYWTEIGIACRYPCWGPLSAPAI